MVLTKFTGSTVMDGTEKSLFKIVGTTMKHFATYVYMKALQAGDTLRLRVYNKVDDVSRWKFDGDVNDSVSTNNGTITNISSLVSQWKFDGDVLDSVGSNNGTITYHTNLKKLFKFENNLNDTIGNGNGTLTGTDTFVTGQEGQAITLDTSSYITIPSTNLPIGTTDRTLSFWWKTPSTFTSGTAIVSWGTETTHGLFGLLVFDTSSTQSRIDAVDWGATDRVTATYLKVNTLYHIVYTLSSAGTVENVYINGVLDSGFPVSGVAQNTASGSMFINNDSSLGRISGGTFDEVRVYNTALSQAQVSALYMNGKFAQSHTFDGGEYDVIANPSNFNFDRTNPFSVSCWVKSTDTIDNQCIISKQTNGGTTGWYINVDNVSHNLAFSFHDSGGTYWQAVTNNNVDDGLWHHYVCTFDGSSNRNGMKVYLDGSLNVTGASGVIANTIANAIAVTVGAFNDGSQPWEGQLDEVRIYNIALTASQVLGLYNYTGSNYISPLPVGNALSLDGSSYVTVANGSLYQFERTKAFTATFWTKWTDTNVKGFMGNSNAGQGWSIDSNSRSIELLLRNTASTNELRVRTTSTYNDGNWHNVIITYSGNSLPSGVNIYIDGVSVGLTTVTNNLSATTVGGSTFGIGSFGTGTLSQIGLIDEVQIFPYVVSAAEINAINAGRFGNTHTIGLWHFDGDLLDYSGQGSHGVLTGTQTFVTGALSGSNNIPNQHFNFDGSEYINIGNISALNFNGFQPMTVAFWFRHSSTIGTEVIIDKQNPDLFNAAGWGIYIDNLPRMHFEIGSTTTNELSMQNLANTIYDGLWHFIVWTIDGSGKASGVANYYDGVAQSLSTVHDTFATAITNSQPLRIGSSYDGLNNFAGELEDLRIYNRALSSAEVSDLYTYPDTPMKELLYDKTYSGVKSDAVYIPMLQGNNYMVTATQTAGTNRVIPWEREELSLREGAHRHDVSYLGNHFIYTIVETIVNLTDAIQKADLKPISETVSTITDSTKKMDTKPISETVIAFTDSIQKHDIKPISETVVAFVDTIKKSTSVLISEVITALVDSVKKNDIRPISESITALTDSIQKHDTKPITESYVNLVDTISKSTSVHISETYNSFVDVIIKSTARFIVEAYNNLVDVTTMVLALAGGYLRVKSIIKPVSIYLLNRSISVKVPNRTAKISLLNRVGTVKVLNRIASISLLNRISSIKTLNKSASVNALVRSISVKELSKSISVKIRNLANNAKLISKVFSIGDRSK